MVAVVVAATVPVATVNVALVAPCATVTLAGTVADALPLESVTTAPPVGAAALKVTVPAALAPPIRAIGLIERDATVGSGGLMVKDACCCDEL